MVKDMHTISNTKRSYLGRVCGYEILIDFLPAGCKPQATSHKPQNGRRETQERRGKWFCPVKIWIWTRPSSPV